MKPVSWIFFGLGWVGTAAISFYAGRSTAPGPAIDPASSAAAAYVDGLRFDEQERPNSGGNPEDTLAGFEAYAEDEAEKDENEREALSVLERLQAALESGDPIQRMKGILDALENLNADNVEDVVVAIRNSSDPMVDGRVLSYLVYKWASFDPAGALEYAGESGDGRREVWLTSTALRSWAANDPDAALVWLSESGYTAGDPNPYLPGILAGWAEQDPFAAARYAAELENGQMRSRSLSGIAREMSAMPKEQLTTWLNGLMDPGFRNQMVTSLSQEMAERDPAGTLDFLEEINPGLTNSRAVGELVEGWAQKDVAEASDWVLNLPSGETRDASMVALINEWSRLDPLAAGEWLNQFPPSPEMDQPVASYATRVQRDDPAGALSWANTITDTELRDNVMIEVASRWVVRDSESALEYLNSSEVPVTVKEQIETRVEEFNARRGGGGGDWRRRVRPSG